MKWITPLALVAALVAAPAAGAQHPGLQAPPAPLKAEPETPPNVPGERQGGDTIADALPINLDYYDHYETTGTTTGYTDDYDEICPYDNSTSPDVVYAISRTLDAPYVDIDMCGSSYDTKIYVYDEAMNVIACNDDFYFDDYCGMYVSKIEAMVLPANTTYYLVIDGYGGDHGDYELAITLFWGEHVECPPDGTPEGEPELVNEYEDAYNGGCNSPQFGNPFQQIMGDGYGEAILCGLAGWYTHQGNNYRDTDWFELMMGSSGTIEVTADATYATLVGELLPQDCASVNFAQAIEVGPISAGTMEITGYETGQVVWLWAGSPDFVPPGGNPPQEYEYVMWLSGLRAAVATEPTSWGAVKALYR